MSDEFKETFKDDASDVPNVEDNSKELLEKSRVQKRRCNKKILCLTYIFSSLVTIGTVILIIVLLLSREQSTIASSNALSAGFGSSEASSPVWVGFSSDKTEIREGENLIIKVYYGTILSYPDDFINQFKKDDVLPDEVNVNFVIRYGRCTKDLLQKGEETYTRPEYIINTARIGETVYKTIDEFGSELYPMLGKDSQYEEIVLTSDLFTEEMGFISFAIKINGVYQGVIDNENSTGSAIVLYYKIDDGNIMLYDSYYKYSKSIIE